MENGSNVMEFTKLKFFLDKTLRCLLQVLSLLLINISFVSAEPVPENIDFIGGYYKNGEYLCYSEPCFSIHRGKGAAAANVRPFEIREWLPRRGDEWSCQQAYTEVLAKASQIKPSFFKKDECTLILNGKWLDTYTGDSIDGLRSIAVDQRISLKEAHHYGGAFWTRAQRMMFAYSPMNLIPVSASQKKARNGRSASVWMPEDKSTWCDYIIHRDIVARHFNLIIPMSEQLYGKEIKKLYCKY